MVATEEVQLTFGTTIEAVALVARKTPRRIRTLVKLRVPIHGVTLRYIRSMEAGASPYCVANEDFEKLKRRVQRRDD